MPEPLILPLTWWRKTEILTLLGLSKYADYVPILSVLRSSYYLTILGNFNSAIFSFKTDYIRFFHNVATTLAR